MSESVRTEASGSQARTRTAVRSDLTVVKVKLVEGKTLNQLALCLGLKTRQRLRAEVAVKAWVGGRQRWIREVSSFPVLL